MDIKEEDPLSNDVASQNESELFIKKTNSNIKLLKHDHDGMIKTEIKSESPFEDNSSQKERDCFGNPLIDQINFETFSCSSNCKMEIKQEIGLGKEKEFLLEDTVVKYNRNNEVHDKIEVKEECWWLNTQTSSAYDDINDGSSSLVKSPRLYIEAVSGAASSDSSFPSSECSMKNTSSIFGKECLQFENQEHVSKLPATHKHVYPEGSDKCVDGQTGRGTLVFHKDQTAFKCNSCGKTFPKFSNLKRHNLTHERMKSHKCDVCEKGFTRLSDLKSHTLIHEGKRDHKCEICEKSFIRLSHLKSHNLMHQGYKPHRCEICEKRFTGLSDFKSHILVHEGKRPHKCEICEKTFTRLSYLKLHVLMHEGIKPHKCEICKKGFTLLSNLSKHRLIHEGTRPHKCEICEKSFTRFSDLKSHNLTHTAIKSHKCEICEKKFTLLSNLRKHILIHEGKRPHRCEICKKKFTRLGNLKSHILLHESK